MRETPAQSATDATERYRSVLTGYCHRMLGSYAEAEDAVRETMVRAWRNVDQHWTAPPQCRTSLRPNVRATAVPPGKLRPWPSI
ncbi:hypothetical protein H4K36_02825 [Streptomyces sp. DHE7-1]|nr:hypothetical protein [Streptomyces sp. DHE7-1]